MMDVGRITQLRQDKVGSYSTSAAFSGRARSACSLADLQGMAADLDKHVEQQASRFAALTGVEITVDEAMPDTGWRIVVGKRLYEEIKRAASRPENNG